MASRRALPLLILGTLALYMGMWSGLVRIGWPWPSPGSTAVASHGLVMVSGFVGVLIALERAVGLGGRWPFAAPALVGVGTIAVLVGLPRDLGLVMIVFGSSVTAAMFAVIAWRQWNAATATMALGSGAWLVGNLLWLAGEPPAHVAMWWTAFLLVIGGERLEISRVLPKSAAAKAGFPFLAGVHLAGVALSGLDLRLGWVAAVVGMTGIVMAGVGMAGVGLWLLRYDLPARQLRAPGHQGFIAAGLVLGYGWLVLGGAALAAFAGVLAGPRYDAVVHAFFLGFVMSMIFAHAPIVFPAVLGRPVPYRPAFYVHLGLLHLGLALRIEGDLIGNATAREWGGLLNAAAIVLFLAVTMASARLGAMESGPAAAR